MWLLGGFRMALRHSLGTGRRAAVALVLLFAALAATITAAPARADTASSIGPVLLSGGGSLPAVQIPSSSLLSFSFGIQNGGSPKGWGGSRYAPKSAATLAITKLVDGTSPALTKHATEGSHYKDVAIPFKNASGSHALCLTDAFISSIQIGSAGGASNLLQEKVNFAYTKFTSVSGGGDSSPCTGGAPPVETSLLGVGERGSPLLARVDCLSAHCRGILTVSLPPAACRAGGSLCAFTGGVRSASAATEKSTSTVTGQRP
jgi:hypothetical protein